MKHVNKLVISWVDAPGIQGDVYFLALSFRMGSRQIRTFAKSDVNEFSFEVIEYLKK